MESEELQSAAKQEIRTKKPYSTPQLVEHGKIEEITGVATPSGTF
jgi:hypothetical protein